MAPYKQLSNIHANPTQNADFLIFCTVVKCVIIASNHYFDHQKLQEQFIEKIKNSEYIINSVKVADCGIIAEAWKIDIQFVQKRARLFVAEIKLEICNNSCRSQFAVRNGKKKFMTTYWFGK